MDLKREDLKRAREFRKNKQRENNVVRAQKMHNARIQDLRDSFLNVNVPAINIGCSGWFYWHWRGQLYPQTLPTTEWFGFYSENFTTVELNAPFYSWPTKANVATWLRQVGNKQFIYTVKVCELITHIKRFCETSILVQDFNYIAELLKSRMGCFIYQLPP